MEFSEAEKGRLTSWHMHAGLYQLMYIDIIVHLRGAFFKARMQFLKRKTRITVSFWVINGLFQIQELWVINGLFRIQESMIEVFRAMVILLNFYDIPSHLSVLYQSILGFLLVLTGSNTVYKQLYAEAGLWIFWYECQHVGFPFWPDFKCV